MIQSLSRRARLAVLLAAIAGLLFDGVELGLMPVASLSVSQDLLGANYTKALGGDWFARFTAALMLGAAIGGIALGNLGDVVGRTRALGISILFYSLFAGLGALAQTQEQMLLLRFLVGLGVGGVWPNAVALAAECWPDKSRPVVAGLMGAALNGGILMLSQIARIWHITPDSWRWIFQLAAVPAVLGVLVLFWLPESPRWLGTRTSERPAVAPVRALFRPPLLRLTLIGILLGSIPMVGAWAASKWMIPWADDVSRDVSAGYKGTTQGWWALGAVLGSFCGASCCAARTPPRLRPDQSWLHRTDFGNVPRHGSVAGLLPADCVAQGFVATLFFGWLPLYLPELFPTPVRAAGSGIAYNVGRFATALGVLGAGALFAVFQGSYPLVGATCGLIYLLGLVVIGWAPDTTGKELE